MAKVSTYLNFQRQTEGAYNFNKTVFGGEFIGAIKYTAASNITLLGSGNLPTQLTAAGLIHEYAVMADPAIIGNGVSLFTGKLNNLQLKLMHVQDFISGVVFFKYGHT